MRNAILRLRKFSDCAEHIYHAERKGGDKFKKRREQLRKQRKRKEDTNTQKGVTYKAGVF